MSGGSAGRTARWVAGAALLLAGPSPLALEAGAQAPDTLPGAQLLDGARQHVVVVVERADATTGRLHRFEREGDGWRRTGGASPAVVGRSGVAVGKREGDGRSPAGIFPLGPAFGYADEAPEGVGMRYRPMAPGTVCVDDPASSHYNRLVDAAAVGGGDWSSAERMRRDLAPGDGLYEWGVVVGYNPEGTPGRGSCIFLHVWRDATSPTVGCTALPEERLLEVMRWLDPDRRPVLVQGTREQLEDLHRRGLLPYPPPRDR